MRIFWMLPLIAACLASVTGPLQAQHPSFPCGSVSRCPEIAICSDPGLARLDNTMAGLYFSLQGIASRPAAQFLLNNQRAWLAQRNSCGCNTNCLYSEYEERIRALQDVIGAQ
jgi:uncharacterized protein